MYCHYSFTAPAEILLMMYLEKNANTAANEQI